MNVGAMRIVSQHLRECVAILIAKQAGIFAVAGGPACCPRDVISCRLPPIQLRVLNLTFRLYALYVSISTLQSLNVNLRNDKILVIRTCIDTLVRPLTFRLKKEHVHIDSAPGTPLAARVTRQINRLVKPRKTCL